MKISNGVICIISVCVFFSCKPKNDPHVKEEPINAAIALEDVSSGECLNLEKFSQFFQSSNFLAPAAMMTTNFKSLNDMPLPKLQYFSYAAFYYKTARANELGLFNQIRQKGCKTVQMLSASEEVMTFNVINSSKKEITIKLTEKFRDSMNVTQKKALYDRQQPYQYHFKYISPTHMVVTEKYRTVDPLCITKNNLAFEIQKDLQWAGRVSDLPQAYSIDAQYLAQIKDSLVADTVKISSLVTEEKVPVETIRYVMQSPLKEELKLCN